MRPKRAIVSVTNDLLTDNRVHKHCLYLCENGWEVILVGRKRKNSIPLPERGYRTVRFRLWKEKGPLFYVLYNIRLFLFILFHRCDLLVSNDLDTLLANYAASRFKPRVKLIYDSHEYFTEVPELQARARVKHFWEALEGWMVPRIKCMYTVNNSIARLYSEKYNKEVGVIRNIPPRWLPSNIPSKEMLGIPNKAFILILQGAGINIDRGAEEAVEAMVKLDEVCLLIVGDGDVVPKLKARVKELKIEDKVLFFGKRPYEEMMSFTYYADLGLTLDKSDNLNYLYSLPNKVFDYMHAETPILCTDLPEVRAVVEKYEIGMVLPTCTPENIRKAIDELRSNPSRLEKMRENCKGAATFENWGAEQKILTEMYAKLFG